MQTPELDPDILKLKKPHLIQILSLYIKNFGKNTAVESGVLHIKATQGKLYSLKIPYPLQYRLELTAKARGCTINEHIDYLQTMFENAKKGELEKNDNPNHKPRSLRYHLRDEGTGRDS